MIIRGKMFTPLAPYLFYSLDGFKCVSSFTVSTLKLGSEVSGARNSMMWYDGVETQTILLYLLIFMMFTVSYKKGLIRSTTNQQ